MRILVPMDIGGEESDEAGKLCKANADLIRRNMGLVKQKDTELTFRFQKLALTGLSTGVDAFSYSYLDHLNNIQFFYGMLNAEEEGFDAVIGPCYYDPMLRDMREAVNIPVVGIAETSMLLATMMGSKFGVITISPEAAFEFEENIAKYGLRERAVRVRPIPLTSQEQGMGLINSHDVIEAFKEVARELIADGAEVLIPGSGFLAPTIRLAPGAETEYPNGLTEVEGVQVMDVMGSAVLVAEALVKLKRAGSCWISRKGFYKQATPEALEQAKGILKYDGPGWWGY